MKSVIYEFDPVIYPFKLLVSKDFDTKELGDMYYCVDDEENLIDSPGEFIPNRRTIARTIQCAPKDGSETFYLVLLYRPKVIGVGTMSHESLHIANFVGEWYVLLYEPCKRLFFFKCQLVIIHLVLEESEEIR